MQFVCRRCGAKNEIRIFSKDIFGCWCDQCGIEILSGRGSFGNEFTTVFLMLVGYEGLVEYLPMVSIPIWILGFLVIIASLLLLWCLRVLAMLLGGGPIYGQEKYEKNSDYLVSCQQCGEELELVEDSNFVQDGVRCPVCLEIFRFRKVEEISDLARWLNIGILLVIIGIFWWYIGCARNIFHENNIICLGYSLLFLIVAILRNVVKNNILMRQYRKRIIRREEKIPFL